jgi:hypothetical protein
MLEQYFSKLDSKIRSACSGLNLDSSLMGIHEQFNKNWQNASAMCPDADMKVLESLDQTEKEIVILALSQNIAPSILLKFEEIRYLNPQLSSVIGGNPESSTFQPTVRTALFLMEPDNLNKHHDLKAKYFSSNSPLFEKGILKPLSKDPIMGDSRLELEYDVISKLTEGKEYEFPLVSKTYLTVKREEIDYLGKALNQDGFDKLKFISDKLKIQSNLQSWFVFEGMFCAEKLQAVDCIGELSQSNPVIIDICSLCDLSFEYQQEYLKSQINKASKSNSFLVLLNAGYMMLDDEYLKPEMYSLKWDSAFWKHIFNYEGFVIFSVAENTPFPPFFESNVIGTIQFH